MGKTVLHAEQRNFAPGLTAVSGRLNLLLQLGQIISIDRLSGRDDNSKTRIAAARGLRARPA